MAKIEWDWYCEILVNEKSGQTITGVVKRTDAEEKLAEKDKRIAELEFAYDGIRSVAGKVPPLERELAEKDKELKAKDEQINVIEDWIEARMDDDSGHSTWYDYQLFKKALAEHGVGR
jgi:hypothetical protein